MAYGTLTLADLLATQRNTTVAKLGVDEAFRAIGNTLRIHNNQLDEMMGDFVEKTTDRLRAYGTYSSMSMQDADEFTVPAPQKITAGANIGFPLNMSVIAFQWTDLWFKKHTVEELAAHVNAAMDADVRRVQRDLIRSIFYATNVDFVDANVDGITLPVKRLVNADSATIPPGPQGESFTASTHTHYIAAASTFASTDMDSLVNTVREHFPGGGDIRVYINRAQEATVAGFSGYLTKYVDVRILPASTSDRAIGKSLDPTSITSRAIGIDHNGAEVWVKPWIPSGYVFAWNAAAPSPVVYRYDPDYGDGLQPMFDRQQDPYSVRGFRRIFGLGVWNRPNGACLYTANTTWADPTVS